MSLATLVAILRPAASVHLATHINPDADAIASALALALALRRVGKRVRVFASGPVPVSCRRLPGADGVTVIRDEAAARRVPVCDVLMAVDCAEAKRLGPLAHLRRQRTAAIDHHHGEAGFAEAAQVDPQAECTGRLVAALLPRLGVALDADLATCLYAALIYDTGRFLHPNTRPATFRLAARLCAAGAAPDLLGRDQVYVRTPHDLAIQRLALDHLEVDRRDPRLAGIALPYAAIQAVGEPDDWGDLIELPRSLVGVEVAYLLRERANGEVRASLRCNPPWKVRPVAETFDGGGHDQASGCTLRGGLASARRALLPRLRAALIRCD